MKLKNPILLGTIGRPQGVRGEVRVKSHTGDPLALADYGVLYDKDGKRFEVLDIRPNKNVVVVRFLGVNDRNAAEALNGTDLFVERDVLSDDELDEDEFFYSDLEGLEAYDKDGNLWGQISALFNFGGGDLIELRTNGKKPMLIPFTLQSVPEVDISAGRILLDPEAAGLLADDDGEAQDGKPRDTRPKGKS